MKQKIVVYHLSADCKSLVEVKRYQRFAWAAKWARKHPKAKVYVNSYLCIPHSVFGWWKFEDVFEIKNAWAQSLTIEEAEKLMAQCDILESE